MIQFAVCNIFTHTTRSIPHSSHNYWRWISFINKYSLIATINHSGTLNWGHYWACIKHLHSSCWYSCNDKLVSNVEESSLNNTTSCILFYRKVYIFFQDLLKYILQGGFIISDIVFGCDNPTYNPSPVRELSLLTQFSGITTLQSLVSEKQCKGAWPIMVLSMRSDDLTHNPSPSSY